MSYYELTEESRMTVHGEVFRIRATEDIQMRKVKKGETGGFLCPDTVLEDGAWVSEEAVVWNSRLLGNVRVMDEALVVDSELTNMCLVKGNSTLKDVKGNGILAEKRTVLQKSKFQVENQKILPLHFSGDANLDECDIFYSGDYMDYMEFRDNAHLSKCVLSGNRMRFLGTTSITKSIIKGSKVNFVNTKQAKRLTLQGERLYFKDVPLLLSTKVEGDDVMIEGDCQITNSEFKGKQIKVSGTEVIVLSTTVHASFVEILNSAKLIHVDVLGENITASDHTHVIGRKGVPVTILSDTTIQDLVKIKLEKGKRATIKGHLSGDILYTGN